MTRSRRCPLHQSSRAPAPCGSFVALLLTTDVVKGSQRLVFSHLSPSKANIVHQRLYTVYATVLYSRPFGLVLGDQLDRDSPFLALFFRCRCSLDLLRSQVLAIH